MRCDRDFDEFYCLVIKVKLVLFRGKKIFIKGFELVIIGLSVLVVFNVSRLKIV